jgi:hypothetical protein
MLAKRQKVRLTSAERDILEKFVAHGTKSARAINRARILLLLDEGRQEKEPGFSVPSLPNTHALLTLARAQGR